MQFYRGKAFERAMAKDREAKERVDAELAARKERLNRMKLRSESPSQRPEIPRRSVLFDCEADCGANTASLMKQCQ